MGFIEFNQDTGLSVKTKVNILQDLKNLFKTAYGQDFEIIEGTELYAAIDLLSSELAETGSAAKAVYDAFGFTSATGTPLDSLCSLAGIYRKEGESDNALRARYYTFLYSNSVGTVEGLKARLLNHTFTDTDGKIYNSVQDVKIENNNTNENKTLLSPSDFKAHSVAIAIRLVKESIPVTHPEVITELSDIISSYISLGCGISVTGPDINFMLAQPVACEMTIQLADNELLTVDTKTAIKETIATNVKNYINSLSIGDYIHHTNICKCVADSCCELNLSNNEYVSIIEAIVSTSIVNQFLIDSVAPFKLDFAKYATCDVITVKFYGET